MTLFSQNLNNDDVQIASSVHSVASSVITASHSLAGKTINYVEFKLYKLGSPTGNMSARVWHADGSIDTIESKTVTTLGSSAAWVRFEASSSITLTDNCWVGIEYTNGTYSQDSVVCRWYVNNNPDSNISAKLYTNSAWSNLTQHEFTFRVDYPYASPSSTIEIGYDGTPSTPSTTIEIGYDGTPSTPGSGGSGGSSSKVKK